MKVPDLNPDFTEENFSRVVDTLNTFMRNVTLLSSMGGQIVEDIQIDANAQVRVSHNLKTVPKYKIILRHLRTASAIQVRDGDDEWTDKYITLSNLGAERAIVSVLIMKE